MRLSLGKLIYLYPLFTNLWIKLADSILFHLNIENIDDLTRENLIKQYLTCYLTIKELHIHGYAQKSEIVAKHKVNEKNWVKS